VTRYEHTQRAPIGLLFGTVAAGAAVAALLVEDRALSVVLLFLAVVFALFVLLFSQLTVRDEPDHLRVRFGPVSLAGTNVRYDRVRALRRARSKVIDGWGIHWVPGRGWTYNLWGFDCVELQTERGLLRIGTDDPEGLVHHLAQRTGLSADVR
jgi:hypothetical protein